MDSTDIDLTIVKYIDFVIYKIIENNDLDSAIESLKVYKYLL